MKSTSKASMGSVDNAAETKTDFKSVIASKAEVGFGRNEEIRRKFKIVQIKGLPKKRNWKRNGYGSRRKSVRHIQIF